MEKKTGKANVEAKKDYHLKITIQGVMMAGKTFSSHKIGELLAANGCHVTLAEGGRLTGMHYGTHVGSTRRVLIDTSLDPIKPPCARCGKDADYLTRPKYDFKGTQSFLCKNCADVNTLYRGEYIIREL